MRGKNLKKQELEELEKREQRERGERIRKIREEELKMNKTQLGKEIGISGQFLGLVEEGKGNLVYKSLKKLKDISGHSADYILYGLDDSILKDTRELLKNYSDKEIIECIKMIKEMAMMIRKK